MRNLLGGLVLIAIGFVWGDSVFLGHITVLSVFFDGLGVFLIIRGLLTLRQQRAGSTAAPTAAPPPARSSQMR